MAPMLPRPRPTTSALGGVEGFGWAAGGAFGGAGIVRAAPKSHPVSKHAANGTRQRARHARTDDRSRDATGAVLLDQAHQAARAGACIASHGMPMQVRAVHGNRRYDDSKQHKE